jgi:ABC-2 type transport system permease protein
MRLRLYWNIFLFNASVFRTYPLEALAVLVKRLIEVGFLIVFWGVVAHSSPGTIDFRSLVAYFLVTIAVNQITMATVLRLAQQLRGLVKRGEISNYFIKPLPVIPTIYASYLGSNVPFLALAMFGFLAALVLQPASGLFGPLAFLVFLGLAMLISLALNLMVGALAFSFNEVNSIRHSISHIIRVFSGSMVPLSYFPDGLRHAVLLSPFPGMVYGPAAALRYTALNAEVIRAFTINASWAVGLMLLAVALWRRTVRGYEAVGI